MIRLAQELLAETGMQIDHHEAEIARLQLLRESLEAFIDQPTATVGEVAPATAGEAAGTRTAASPIHSAAGGDAPATAEPEAAASPPGDEPPATQRPTAGQGAPPTSPPSAPRPQLLVECPDCGTQVKQQGLGTHRRWAHGHAAPSKRERADEKGTFLCPKGCGRPFDYLQNAQRHAKDCDGAPITAVIADEAGQPAGAWQPQPEGSVASRQIVGSKERWLCNRCSAPFNTEESRDRHQATHPAIEPPPMPTGGQRIRRTPPNGAYATVSTMGAGE